MATRSSRIHPEQERPPAADPVADNAIDSSGDAGFMAAPPVIKKRPRRIRAPKHPKHGAGCQAATAGGVHRI